MFDFQSQETLNYETMSKPLSLHTRLLLSAQEGCSCLQGLNQAVTARFIPVGSHLLHIINVPVVHLNHGRLFVFPPYPSPVQNCHN